MGKRFTPLTEGGILAALAVVLGLAAAFLPVLGVFAALLWALPLLVLTLRQGLRQGILAAIAAAIVLALFLGPIESARLAVAFAPTGLALGVAFARNFSGTKSFLCGLGASVGGKIVGLALLFFLMGVNPWEAQLSGLSEAFSETFSVYESMGMDAQQLAASREQVDAAMATISRLAPLVLLLMGLCDTVSLYIVAPRVLRRLGMPISQQLPRFSEWRLPRAFLYLFVLSLVGLYWGAAHEIPPLYTAALNANLLSMCAGGIQGLSLLSALFLHFHVSRFLRVFLYVFICLNGLLLQILAFAGLVDLFFDYRGRLGRRR